MGNNPLIDCSAFVLNRIKEDHSKGDKMKEIQLKYLHEKNDTSIVRVYDWLIRSSCES